MRFVFQMFIAGTLAVAMHSSAISQTAQNLEPLTISRDSQGAIHKSCRPAIREINRIAQDAGHVRLWLTLDAPFDPNLPEVSEEAHAAQISRIDEVFDLVLDQLLEQQEIWYPDGQRDYNGPSIVVVATKQGFRQLLRDERIGQIIGVRDLGDGS